MPGSLFPLAASRLNALARALHGWGALGDGSHPLVLLLVMSSGSFG